MTIRKLLFVLLLYSLLAGIVAYFRNPDDLKLIFNTWLFLTAVGIAGLLLVVVLQSGIEWWARRRAARSAQPAAEVKASVHEDDAALAGLLREADDQLAQAPVSPGERSMRASGLPLHLIVGPERSGKTAAVHNCGVELRPLAGQVAGGESIVPTQVANLWLGHDSLFCEVGGRVFSSELERFTAFLGVLKSGGSTSGLRALKRGLSLRSVLLVYDSRAFAGTPDQSALSKSAQQIRDRLSAIAAVFGARFPVYVLFTNLDGTVRSDGVPYFSQFFARLGESEAGQVLGVLSPENPPSQQNRVWAEAETKRLSRLFQSVLMRLGDRRMLALAQETEASKKPGIYEFPREFRKIRGPLIQFLVDVFKPDPLKASPWMRGFFFAGTRKTEQLDGASTEMPSVYASRRSQAEATRIFSPQRPGSATEQMSVFSPSASLRLVDRWLFLTELFHTVLGLDQPIVHRMAPAGKFERYRKAVIGTCAACAIFLFLVWTTSFINNWGMVRDMDASVTSVKTASTDLSLANLKALENLRAELEQLDRDDSWIPHWGLYTGDRLKESGLKAYFDRLKLLSLLGINKTLVQHLRKLDTPATYDKLKAHRILSTEACKVDRPFLSKVLMDTTIETHPEVVGTSRALLGKQFDFYIQHLKKEYEPLVQLEEDRTAVAIARDSLSKASGPEKRYQQILGIVRGQVKPLEVSASYAEVLTGSNGVPGEFTKDGRAAFENEVSDGNFRVGDDCVMGSIESAKSVVIGMEAQNQIRSLYYREYAKAWREFLGSYRVKSFSGAKDAASKLGKLADTLKSPLLGIVRLVAINTKFEDKAAAASVLEKAEQGVARSGKVPQPSSGLQKGIAIAKQNMAESGPPLMTAADVTRLFQPAWFTTPQQDLLVDEHNKGYVEGLSKLQQSMENYDSASTVEKPGAIQPARAAAQAATSAYQSLIANFRDTGEDGTTGILSQLLEEPIKHAKVWIPANPEVLLSGKGDGELQKVCSAIGPLLKKYPFDWQSHENATLNEIGNAFAPGQGKVWQYTQQSGAELVVRHGKEWVPNPTPPQGVHVDARLPQFLTRAQQLTDAFFAGGGTQPKFTYKLRPIPGYEGVIKLVLDGTEMDSSATSLQKDFHWPGASPGAEGISGPRVYPGTSPFGKFSGDLWGVFRLFKNADERTLNNPQVQWSQSKGIDGSSQLLKPPAKIEILDFPGGADLFNPKFFEGLRCPQKAVSTN
jgi:type VI secretion system protein ImpL